MGRLSLLLLITLSVLTCQVFIKTRAHALVLNACDIVWPERVKDAYIHPIIPILSVTGLVFRSV